MNTLPELNFSLLSGKGVEPGPFHCLLPPDLAHSAQLRDLLLHPNLSEIIDSDKDRFPHWLTLPPTLTANALQVTAGGFSEP